MLAWSDTTTTASATKTSPRLNSTRANLLACPRFPGEERGGKPAGATDRLAWTPPGRMTAGKSRLSFRRILRGHPPSRAIPRPRGWMAGWCGLAFAGLAGHRAARAGRRRAVGPSMTGPPPFDPVVKSEARAFWRSDRVDLNAGYLFLPGRPAERPRRPTVSGMDLRQRNLPDRTEVWSVGLDARVAAQSEPIVGRARQSAGGTMRRGGPFGLAPLHHLRLMSSPAPEFRSCRF